MKGYIMLVILVELSVDNLEWCTYSYNNAYTYNSTIEAGFITGLNRASISKCCSGYLKTYKSFKWRYG